MRSQELFILLASIIGFFAEAVSAEGEVLHAPEEFGAQDVHVDYLTKYNATAIQITFSNIVCGLRGLSIDSTNIPVFKVIEGASHGQKTPSLFNLPSDIYFRDPILQGSSSGNSKINEKSQVSLFHPLDFVTQTRFNKETSNIDGVSRESKCLDQFSLYVFTNFYNVSNIEMSFSLISSANEPKTIKLLQKIKGIVPMIYHKRLLLDKMELGLQYHYLFNQKFLDRNLSIYPDIQAGDQVFFMTYPRSGTHAYVRSLGDILGEFVQLNNYLNDTLGNDRVNYDILNGEWKGNNSYIRIMVNHIIPREKIANRFLFSVREFVEAFDSAFVNNARMSTRVLPCKWNQRYMEGYHHEDLYEKTILAKVQLFQMQLKIYIESNIPVYTTRYEDLIQNPLEVLCGVISFIEGIECEKLAIYSSLNRIIGSGGIRSSYTNNHTGAKSSQARKTAWNFVKMSLVEGIYEALEKWIYFFDYQDLYKKVGSKKIEVSARNFERRKNSEMKFWDFRDKFFEMMMKHQVKWENPYEGLDWEQKTYKKNNTQINEVMKSKIFIKYVHCSKEEVQNEK